MPDYEPLSAADAILQLEAWLAVMKANTDRDQITKIPMYADITVDDAFELGYSTAISDFKGYTREND